MLDIIKSFLTPLPDAQSGTHTGRYYERSGACNQCGKCCSRIYLIHGKETIRTPEQFDRIRERNPEYNAFTPVETVEDGLLFDCAHLQADKSCAIYEHRPDFCRNYPSEHSLLMGGKLAEGCGYSFRLLKSFNSVLSDIAQKEGIKKEAAQKAGASS